MSNRPRCFPTVHLGHREVREHDIKRAPGNFCDRVPPIFDHDDAMTQIRQHVGQRLAYDFLVVDDHDRERFSSGCGSNLFVNRNSVLSNWQIYAERRAFTDSRLDADHALVSFDNAVAYSETKAGSVNAFRCIERLEHALAHFFSHPHPAVGKSQVGTVSVAGATDLETATVRHGIHRVNN